MDWTVIANFNSNIRNDTFVVEKPSTKIIPNSDGIDGIYVNDLPYYLGGKGNFYICTTTERTIIDIKLVDASNIFHNYNSKLPITLDNQCMNLHTDDFNLAGFNLGGDWALLADTNQGKPFIYDFSVTFMVLPESAIGAVALVGASLTIFMYWNKKNKQ